MTSAPAFSNWSARRTQNYRMYIPLWLIIVGSVLFFIVGLVGAFACVVYLPVDYFVADGKKYFWDHHPVLRIVVLILRNVLGLAVIAVGILMLIGPGQGVLTILLGLALLTFPGKRKLLRKIASRPAVRNGMNAIRARFNRPPLLLDEPDDEAK